MLHLLIAISYPYWAAPAAALLNIYMSRKLHGALGFAGAVGMNLAITLLILAPMAEPWGFKNASGVVYLPWLLMVTLPGDSDMYWLGVVALGVISVVTSTISISRMRKPAG